MIVWYNEITRTATSMATLHSNFVWRHLLCLSKPWGRYKQGIFLDQASCPQVQMRHRMLRVTHPPLQHCYCALSPRSHVLSQLR